LEARIYLFPQSALKKNGVKISYVDFVRENRNECLSRSVEKIIPRIDINAINSFIDTVPLLTDIQREFYKYYVEARFKVLFNN
jgi:hypothetical protein